MQVAANPGNLCLTLFLPGPSFLSQPNTNLGEKWSGNQWDHLFIGWNPVVSKWFLQLVLTMHGCLLITVVAQHVIYFCDCTEASKLNKQKKSPTTEFLFHGLLAKIIAGRCGEYGLYLSVSLLFISRTSIFNRLCLTGICLFVHFEFSLKSEN